MTKDSFLRALREVASEMELFLENHGQYIKKIAIKLIYIQSCTFCHFTKKIVSWKICLKRHSAIYLCGNSLKHYYTSPSLTNLQFANWSYVVSLTFVKYPALYLSTLFIDALSLQPRSSNVFSRDYLGPSQHYSSIYFYYSYICLLPLYNADILSKIYKTRFEKNFP